MDQIRGLCREIETADKGHQHQASLQGEAAAKTALVATSVVSLGLLLLFAVRLGPGVTHPRFRMRPWPLRYGVAITAATAAFLMRMALTPLIGVTELAFAVALPAVRLAAWFGGLGPGFVCVLVSGVTSAYYFAEPAGSFLVNNLNGSDIVESSFGPRLSEQLYCLATPSGGP